MGVRVCVYACWVKMKMAWNDFWQANFFPSFSLFSFFSFNLKATLNILGNKMYAMTEGGKMTTTAHIHSRRPKSSSKNMMKEVGKSYCCIIPCHSLATSLKGTNINWFAVVHVSENNVYFRFFLSFVLFYASFCFVLFFEMRWTRYYVRKCFCKCKCW